MAELTDFGTIIRALVEEAVECIDRNSQSFPTERREVLASLPDITPDDLRERLQSTWPHKRPTNFESPEKKEIWERQNAQRAVLIDMGQQFAAAATLFPQIKGADRWAEGFSYSPYTRDPPSQTHRIPTRKSNQALAPFIREALRKRGLLSLHETT